MVVVTFRTRLRTDASTSEPEALATSMQGLASQMPGFVSYKNFCAADAENLALVELTNETPLLDWREQREHAQRQYCRRREFFGHHPMQVFTPYRSCGFSWPANSQTPG